MYYRYRHIYIHIYVSIYFYSWPSISMGSTSEDSTNHGSNIFGGSSYVVAGMCYVVRLVMVVSVLNMYHFFSCHYSLNTV